MAEADRACSKAVFSELCRKNYPMRKKTKPQTAQDRRREAVTILAAATRGAIDRYFELFLDELDRTNHSLRLAERWAERGGELPRAVGRHKGLAKVVCDTPLRCRGDARCAQCKAEQELSRWSLLGFEASISGLFDLMAGRSNDLDAALAQLESTVLDLTGNGIFTDVIMAHAFARAGYGPGARRKRPVLVDAHIATVGPGRGAHRRGPDRRNGLRVLDGGKSRVAPPSLMR